MSGLAGDVGGGVGRAKGGKEFLGNADGYIAGEAMVTYVITQRKCIEIR